MIKVQRISDWGACYHIHIISSSSRAQGVSQKRWEDCRTRGQGHLLRTVCLDKLWLPHKYCQSQYSQYSSMSGGLVHKARLIVEKLQIVNSCWEKSQLSQGV